MKRTDWHGEVLLHRLGDKAASLDGLDVPEPTVGKNDIPVAFREMGSDKSTDRSATEDR